MSQDPTQRVGKKSWTVDTIRDPQPAPKKEKFDFQKMKSEATSDNPDTRRVAFIEYFERFNEFPSFLFDNETRVDPRLAVTIQDLYHEKDSSKAFRDGITALVNRLPS